VITSVSPSLLPYNQGHLFRSLSPPLINKESQGGYCKRHPPPFLQDKKFLLIYGPAVPTAQDDDGKNEGL